jgi:hypothetical protein
VLEEELQGSGKSGLGLAAAKQELRPISPRILAQGAAAKSREAQRVHASAQTEYQQG